MQSSRDKIETIKRKVKSAPDLELSNHHLADELISLSGDLSNKLWEVKSQRAIVQEELAYAEAKVQDLSHVIQIGVEQGILKAPALSKLSKELGKVRNIRENLKRENCILTVASDNASYLANKLSRFSKTLDGTREGFKDKKYTLRTMSLDEVQKLTNIDMDKVKIYEVLPDIVDRVIPEITSKKCNSK